MKKAPGVNLTPTPPEDRARVVTFLETHAGRFDEEGLKLLRQLDEAREDADIYVEGMNHTSGGIYFVNTTLGVFRRQVLECIEAGENFAVVGPGKDIEDHEDPRYFETVALDSSDYTTVKVLTPEMLKAQKEEKKFFEEVNDLENEGVPRRLFVDSEFGNKEFSPQEIVAYAKKIEKYLQEKEMWRVRRNMRGNLDG